MIYHTTPLHYPRKFLLDEEGILVPPSTRLRRSDGDCTSLVYPALVAFGRVSLVRDSSL